MEQNEGVKSFLQKAAQQTGVEFNNDKADSLIKSYNGDYSKLITDVGRKIGIDDNTMPEFTNRARKTYGIYPEKTDLEYQQDWVRKHPKLNALFQKEGMGLLNDAYIGTKKMIGSFGTTIDVMAENLGNNLTGGYQTNEKDEVIAPWEKEYKQPGKSDFAKKIEQFEKEVPASRGGLTAFFGQMLPQVTGLIATTLLRNKSVSEAYLASMYGTSFGSGIENYDKHIKETGETPNANDRNLVGIGYGAAEYLGEKVGLDYFMPKGYGKLTSGAINPIAAKEIGKSVIENYAKLTKQSVPMILKKIIAGSQIEGGQEVATEGIDIAIDKWITGENVTGEDVKSRLIDAYKGGVFMSAGVMPFAHISQNASTTQRRRQQGKVTIGIDEQGLPLEIIKTENGIIGIRPNGDEIDNISEQTIKNSATFKTEDFEKTMSSLKKGSDVLSEDWKDKSIEQNLLNSQIEGQSIVNDVPKRVQAKKEFEQASTSFNNIQNPNYTKAVNNILSTYTDPKEIITNFNKVSNEVGATREEYDTALKFISSSVKINSLKKTKQADIQKGIDDFSDNEGNVTSATIEGEKYYIKNTADLGQPGKIIFAKNQAGEVKPFNSVLVKDWSTLSPDQIQQTAQQQEDEEDNQFDLTTEVNNAAAQIGIKPEGSVKTPNGIAKVVSINSNGTVTVVNQKGLEDEFNIDEVEAYKTDEQKQAEKEALAQQKENEKIQAQQIEEEAKQKAEMEKQAIEKQTAEAESDIPRDKEGNPDYNAMEPETFYNEYAKEFSEEEAKAEIQDMQRAIVEDIKEKTAKKSKATSLNERASINREIKKLKTRLDNINSVLQKDRSKVAGTDTKWIAENSTDANEIASAYQQEQENAPVNNLQEWQKYILGVKFNPDSFNRFGDKNNVTSTLAKTWLRNDGHDIDQFIRDNFEDVPGFENVTEQDVIDFITENPTGHIRKTTDTQNQLKKRYREITGVSIDNHKFDQETLPTQAKLESFLKTNGLNDNWFSTEDLQQLVTENKDKLSENDYNEFTDYLSRELTTKQAELDEWLDTESGVPSETSASKDSNSKEVGSTEISPITSTHSKLLNEAPSEADKAEGDASIRNQKIIEAHRQIDSYISQAQTNYDKAQAERYDYIQKNGYPIGEDATFHKLVTKTRDAEDRLNKLLLAKENLLPLPNVAINNDINQVLNKIVSHLPSETPVNTDDDTQSGETFLQQSKNKPSLRVQDKSEAEQTIDYLQSIDKSPRIVIYKSKDEIISYIEENKHKYSRSIINKIKDTLFGAFFLKNEIFINSDKVKTKEDVVTCWIHERVHAQTKELYDSESLSQLYDQIGVKEIQRVVPHSYWMERSYIQADEYISFAAEKLSANGKLDDKIPSDIQNIILNIVNNITSINNLTNGTNNLDNFQQGIEGRNAHVGDSDRRGTEQDRTDSEGKGVGSGTRLQHDEKGSKVTFSDQANIDLKERHNALASITKIGTELNIPVNVVNSSELTSDNGQITLTDNGTVTIVSDRVKSVSETIKALVKEVAGENGIREMLANADPNSIVGKQLAKFDELSPEELQSDKLAQVIRKAFRLTSNQFSQEDLNEIIKNQKEKPSNKNVRFRTEDQSQIIQDARKYSDFEDFVDAYQNANFRDSHSAPSNSQSGLTVHERMDQGDDFNLAEVVQGFSTQPQDYFDPRNGARWYGYNDKEGMQSYFAIRSAMNDINSQIREKGEITKMPKIKAYRAVPKDVSESKLIDRDWITFSKEYAKGHGEHRFGKGEYKVINQSVPADQVWWDGNDINEWGYDTGQTETLGRSDLKRIWDEVHGEPRFRILGETGASNLDKAEEVTTRLDNLKAAREMKSGSFNWENRTSNTILENPFEEEVPSKEKAAEINKWVKENTDKYNPKYVKFYHATGENIPIDSEGLKRTTINRRRSYQSESGYVYLANTPERAKSFGDLGNGGKSIVYEVIVPVSELLPDKDQLNNQRSVGNDVGNTVGESIIYGGGVRIKGDISPWQSRRFTPFTAKEIRLATGWEKGVDGKWRYETPDGKYKRNIFTILKEKVKGLELSDVYVDDSLYKSYPQLKSLPFVVEPIEKGTNGFYDGKKIVLNETLVTDNETQTREELIKSVLVHEIQHAIQEIEGFAKGGSITNLPDKQFESELYQVERELKKAIELKNSDQWVYNSSSIEDIIKSGDTPPRVKEWAINIAKEGEKGINEFLANTPIEQYRRLAGEVESRNVQTRMNLTPEERLNTLLSETEDVSREDQIVLMDGLGVSNLEQPFTKYLKANDVKTGQPVTLTYLKNTEKAPYLGSRFGQDVEPSGFYFIQKEHEFSPSKGWIEGQITLNNPLVIPLTDENMIEYKNELSEQYKGKKKKALTNALKADGYDGIITTKGGYLGEMVKFDFDPSESDLEEQIPSTITVNGVERPTGNNSSFSNESNDIRFRMIAQNPDFKKEHERYNGNDFEIKDNDLYTTLYNTRFDTDNSGEFLGTDININKAIDAAESNPYDYNYKGASVSISAEHLKIPVQEILDNTTDDEFQAEDITNDEIRDFLKGGDTYKYTVDDDYYTYAESEADNANTDDLIYDVRKELSNRFNANIEKYSSVYVDREGNITGEQYDNNDNENREVSIRIADHTHNPRNGRPDVTVVIANKNATSGKFAGASTDLSFDEDYTSDEIANEIEQYIKDNYSVDDLRFHIDQEASEVNTNPSVAQREAGNYQKGHIKFDGFDISIENPKGSTRSGVDRDGNKWSNTMPADYGYFKKTIGRDKDHIDVFIGAKPELNKVYVIDQIDPKTGKFDEHKVMLGFDGVTEARKTYQAAYSKGWNGLQDITRTTKEGLKDWFENGNTKKPFADSEVRFKKEPIQSPIGFYSPTEKALSAIQQEKGTVVQFEKMLLDKGAKQAELDWMGWSQQFPSVNAKITKTDIQNWIDQNKIEVEEVQKGEIPKSAKLSRSEALRELERGNAVYGVDAEGQESLIETLDDLDRYDTWVPDEYYETDRQDGFVPMGDTKFSQYTLPGGENYKELLLTMPNKEVDYTKIERQFGLYEFSEELYGKNYDDLTSKELVELQNEFNKKHPEKAKQLSDQLRKARQKENSEFKSSHFDEPNILAHVRFNEREVNGEKVLFIEEWQADKGQEWQKLKKLIDSGKATQADIDRYNFLDKNFPFNKTSEWLPLAMRRMMRYAAENGFDRIAWTTGEQQADRYDLSKSIDKVYYNPNTKEFGYFVKGEKTPEIKTKTEPTDIENYIGKDATKKLLDSPLADDMHEIEGNDLKVGGEGMKAFYNAIVPSAANKLGKPFGARVENIQIDVKPEITDEGIDLESGEIKAAPEGKYATVQSIPVTESMKESVMEEGIPMFRIEDKLSAVRDIRKLSDIAFRTTQKNANTVPESKNAETEAAMNKAHGLKGETMQSKIDRWKQEIKETTQHFKYVTEKEFPQVYNDLRLFESIPEVVKKDAYDKISNIIKPIVNDKNQYKAFERYIVIADLMHDIESGLYTNTVGIKEAAELRGVSEDEIKKLIESKDIKIMPHEKGERYQLYYDSVLPGAPKSDIYKELPFNMKSVDEVQDYYNELRQYVKANPDLQKVIANRNSLIYKVREQLIENGLMAESARDNTSYFHHMVMKFREEPKKNTAVNQSYDLRVHPRGWQKARTGSMEDYNTDYIQSEFEVIAQSLEQLAVKKSLQKIGQTVDIMPSLVAQANKEGGSWREYIPEGYTTWHPKPGTNAWAAASIAEKAIQSVIEGNPLAESLNEQLAEADQTLWVIPEKIAAQLDEMKVSEKEILPVRGMKFFNSTWKQWILLNPARLTKYMINNLSGDLDIVFAYNPKILLPKYSWTAAKELYFEAKGEGMSKDMKEAIENAVISSGLSIQEIPDVNKEGVFKTLTGDDNFFQKYWNSATSINDFRESMLRLAAYKFFKEELNSGKKHHGASNPKAIDALRSNEEKAGKMARELLGDYGNLSQGGMWLRSHAYPFWSWMEINAPRYYRLLRNTYLDSNSTKQTLGVAARKTALSTTALAARVMLLAALVTMWNRMFFPDEDDELTKTGNRQLRLITGRRDDGSIITLRIQGAFSDVLSFVGLEDAFQDVKDVRTGKTTVGKKVKEAGSAFVNRVGQGAMPFERLTGELLTGKSAYPDILHPRPIIDRAEHAFRMVSLDKVYRFMTKKPLRKGGKELIGLVLYETDPGEAAYYAMRQRIYDFLDEKEYERPSGDPTEKSIALRYYKQAKKFKDTKLENHWWAKYKALGGTKEGMRMSIKKGEVTSALPKEYKREFLDKLDGEDREVLQMAEKWYDETYK